MSDQPAPTIVPPSQKVWVIPRVKLWFKFGQVYRLGAFFDLCHEPLEDENDEWVCRSIALVLFLIWVRIRFSVLAPIAQSNLFPSDHEPQK